MPPVSPCEKWDQAALPRVWLYLHWWVHANDVSWQMERTVLLPLKITCRHIYVLDVACGPPCPYWATESEGFLERRTSGLHSLALWCRYTGGSLQMMWVWSVHMVHTHSLTHLDRYSSYVRSYETSSESKLGPSKRLGLTIRSVTWGAFVMRRF